MQDGDTGVRVENPEALLAELTKGKELKEGEEPPKITAEMVAGAIKKAYGDGDLQAACAAIRSGLTKEEIELIAKGEGDLVAGGEDGVTLSFEGPAQKEARKATEKAAAKAEKEAEKAEKEAEKAEKAAERERKQEEDEEERAGHHSRRGR